MHAGVDVVGWLFLHTLWQVPLVAALLALVLWVRSSAGPEARERWGLCALTIVLLAAGATLLAPAMPAAGGAATTPPAATAPTVVGLDRDEAGGSTRASSTLTAVPGDPGARPRSAPPLLHVARGHIGALAPWLGWGWLTLVATGLLRLVGARYLIARTRRAAMPAPPHLAERFAAVAVRLGVAHPPRLLVSLAVRAPVVVGAWRPTVLLPTEPDAALTEEHLEALLAHELEHVRRRDHVAALLFALFDTVFALHPGARWITNTLRSAREHRCDAAAVALAGDAESYARALLALVRSDGDRSRSFRLAATDGSLLQRVQALLGVPRPRRRRGWIPPVVGVGAAILMAGALAALPPTAPVGSTPDGHVRLELASLIAPGDTWTWVTVIGPLRTDDTFETVTGVDPEGRVVFEERRADGWRRVVITQHGDEPRFEQVVDGSSVDFGEEGRAWLTGILATETLRRQLEGGLLGEWLAGRSWGTSGNRETREYSSDVRMSVDAVEGAPAILDRQIESLRGEGPFPPPPRSRSWLEEEQEFVNAAVTAHHLAAHGLITAEQLQEHLADLEALDPRVTSVSSDPGDWEVIPAEPPPGATWIWITTLGDVASDADGVRPIEPGGRVVVEERSRAGGERRYEAWLDAAGAVHETYRIDGRDAPLDDAARERVRSLLDDPSIRRMLAHDERDDRGRLHPLLSAGQGNRSTVRLDVGDRAERFLNVAILTGQADYVDTARSASPREVPPLDVLVSWYAFRARHLAAHGLIDDDALARHLEALDDVLEGAAQ